MKDFTKKELESSRPTLSPKEAVDFCLEAFYKDKEHFTTDPITRGVCFEELIGALLLARDVIKQVAEDAEDTKGPSDDWRRGYADGFVYALEALSFEGIKHNTLWFSVLLCALKSYWRLIVNPFGWGKGEWPHEAYEVWRQTHNPPVYKFGPGVWSVDTIREEEVTCH